jgi:branched-chain amino acid transport system substrate-binding protein
MRLSARWLLLLALALGLAVLAAGCGGDDEEGEGAEAGQGATTAEDAGAVECGGKIGIMGPFTGDVAAIGQEQLNWAKFAIEKYNDENGTTFELVEGDTQLDPAQASTVAQRWVSDESILAVVGPAASQEVEAVGPLFDRAKIGFVSASATREDLTAGKYPTFFRVVPHDGVQGPTDAEFMAEELGAKKVMIVDNQTSYSTGLSDAVEKRLEELDVEVDRQSATTRQTDFSALVSRISDHDAVFLPLQVAANAQNFAQQVREQGKDVEIVGSDGVFSPEEFTAEGAYVSAFAPDIRGIPEDEELVAEFNEKYGEEWGTFGPPVYVATQVVMDAASRACEDGEPTRESILEQLPDTNIEDSILGNAIAFDDNGDVEGATFFLFQIRNGKFELVEDTGA